MAVVSRYSSWGYKQYSITVDYSREYGSSIDATRKAVAHDEILVHNQWFLKHIMHSNDVEVNTIMIVPRFDKRYRDEYLP